jgi:hypothetical protein
MKPSEWLKICDQVANLWPSSAWKPPTAAAAYPLFEAISVRAAYEAVIELSTAGREFAPPPGVLRTHAQVIDANLRPALPDPDQIRDLTPEEQARSRDMAERIRKRVTELAEAKRL